MHGRSRLLVRLAFAASVAALILLITIRSSDTKNDPDAQHAPIQDTYTGLIASASSTKHWPAAGHLEEIRARLAREALPRVEERPNGHVVFDRSHNGMRRIDVEVTAADGLKLTAAMLLRDEIQTPAPTLLVLPGHVGPHESGLQQLITAEPSYHHSAGLRLAEAGFVVVAVELRGFGALGHPNYADHTLVAYNAIQNGSYYKALVTRDLNAIVQWASTRPEVDVDRIGVTGVSLGGEMAVHYAAVQPNISAVAFSSYGGGTGPFAEIFAADTNQPHYCHIIPGQLLGLRQEDVFRLLAPRPTLGIRGDSNGPFSETFKHKLRSEWRKHKAINNLTLQDGRGGHEYFVEETIQFFTRTLADE